MSVLLWVVLPYSAFLCFLLGQVWRYRHDRFGAPELGPDAGRLERFGPTVFRLGVGGVVVGRVLELIGSQPRATGSLHGVATVVEQVAQPLAVLGALMLLVPPLVGAVPRTVVSPLDRITLPVLAVAAFTRVAVNFAPTATGGGFHAADTLFVWARSLWALRPDPDSIAHAPLVFQARGLAILLLIAIWPYTRLGGTFAGPIVRALDRRRTALRQRVSVHDPVR
ncbi:respiratory nitrate reductase subunit gamma [Nocardia sp. NPDC004068]|uniref:respiratory nitrate reductase subunit gamma n=1 Tax=Nocardia sp. NPDC004068 TaxID=3364303 RepID=UPI0036B46A6E